MHACSRELFDYIFVGAEGHKGLEQFWEKQRHSSWAQQHPGLVGKDIRTCIPLGIHADKGRHVARDKMLIIQWGSVTSHAPTIWSKNVFAVVPDELLVKNVTDEEHDAVLVWSVHMLMGGAWPEKDPYGNDWPHGSRRWCMRGKPLAGEFTAVFSEYRGDWEWAVDTFMWRLSKNIMPGCLRNILNK